MNTKFYRDFFDKKGNLKNQYFTVRRDIKEKLHLKLKSKGVKEDVDNMVDL